MSIQLQPQRADLEQWARLARKAGADFEVLDLQLLHNADFEEQGKIAAHYRETGMIRTLHGAFIDVNPASGDPDLCRLSRQRCRESCEIAVLLGADNLVFHSSAFPFLREAYLENWANVCASFYEELVESYPVRLYIENAQDLDPIPLRKLMEKLHTDRVGICLDVGHANYSRAPISRWFKELGDWIQCLHLSDNGGEFDDHLPLGRGTIDWSLVNRLWEGLGRDIPVTLETGDIASTMESVRFLCRNGYFGLKGNGYEKF